MLQRIAWPVNHIGAFYSHKPLDFSDNANIPPIPHGVPGVLLNQVHGNQVNVFDKAPNQLLEGDAMITTQSNLALIIRTADCLPILLSTQSGSVVAAVHAGWRSLQQNIIQSTIDKIQSISADPLYAWIGPSICQQHFEVGDDVVEAFNQHVEYFSKGANNKYHGNLKGIAHKMLQNYNVKDIKTVSDCTACDPAHYYSYRKNKDLGRMASVIIKLPTAL